MQSKCFVNNGLLSKLILLRNFGSKMQQITSQTAEFEAEAE